MEEEENFLPLVKDDRVHTSPLTVDVLMASKMNKEELIKTHAIEQTIRFLKDRQVAGYKQFNEIYEAIYDKLKNNGESTN